LFFEALGASGCPGYRVLAGENMKEGVVGVQITAMDAVVWTWWWWKKRFQAPRALGAAVSPRRGE
jgi:hypothetical protein